MNKRTKQILKATLYGCLLGAYGHTYAADVTDTAPAGNQAAAKKVAANAVQTIEEVTVTATKRRERMQDVPIAITALSERTLALRGLDKTEDYLASLPGMSLLKDYAGTVGFSVRGIATTTGPIGTSSPAGLYIDDYSVFDTNSRFASPDMRVFDVERIEVLRGPQGTLFGASSLAGAMRIITNKPDAKAFDAKIEVSGAAIKDGGNDYALNAMVNQPLSPDTALRLVAYDHRDGGWIDNWAQGKNDVNSGKSTGARVALSQQVTPKLKVLGTFIYQKNTMDDGSYTYYYPPAGRSIEQWKGLSPQPNVTNQLEVGELSADYDLDWATLSMYLIHGKNMGRSISDYSAYTKIFGGPNVATPGKQAEGDSKENTYEARLASKGAGPLKYTVGAYYSSRNRILEQAILSPALIPTFGTANILTDHFEFEAAETALFGEATYHFTEQWSATAGARASKLDYTLRSALNGLLSGSVTKMTYTDTVNNGSAVTPKLALSYQPDSATNAYAAAAKGYRFGLANYYIGALNAASGIDLAYKPDSLWNYELGLKKSMLGGKLVSNSALYYIDWKDIQLGFANSQGTGYTTNAGKARAYGFEQELSYRPSGAWELNLAFALSKAEMSEDSPGVQRRGGSSRGPAVKGLKKGDRLPGAPEATLSAGVQYNIPEFMSGKAHIRLDTAYVGTSYIDFMSEGSLQIGGYTTTNLRLGYTTGHYDWVVFASNLFNSRGITNASANVDLIPPMTDAAFRVKPRTLGVTLRYQY